MVKVPAFQAGYEGSIPFTRTIFCYSSIWSVWFSVCAFSCFNLSIYSRCFILKNVGLTFDIILSREISFLLPDSLPITLYVALVGFGSMFDITVFPDMENCLSLMFAFKDPLINKSSVFIIICPFSIFPPVIFAFIVILLNHMRNERSKLSSYMGLFVSAICLVIFGTDSFTIPTMITLVALLTIFRKQIEKRYEK